MRVLAVVLAAGSGSRFGSDKAFALLGDKPVWRWSFDAFLAHPEVEAVGVVVAPSRLQSVANEAPDALFVKPGGETRSASSLVAVNAGAGFDAILIHDAARPFLSAEVIASVIRAIESESAAAPGVPVVDTLYLRDGDAITPLDRASLFAIQTPQGARLELLVQAYANSAERTDEVTLLKAIGVEPAIVPGSPDLFKITYPDDLVKAEAIVAARSGQTTGGMETRTGLGYDIHAFREPRESGTVLGGVIFEDGPKLDGHSDADVLIHAIVDSLLGAGALGDIGQHFPNTDPEWKGASSTVFLKHAARLISEAGWRILNIDATVIAETPRVMQRAVEVREHLARALVIEASRVSLKATTNERLGAIGRSEGIAAFAVATIQAVKK